MPRARLAACCLCCSLLAVALTTSAARAERVTLDKPVPVNQRKADKSKVAGKVVAFDDAGFDVAGKGDETQAVRWGELDARTVFVVRKSLIGPKDALAHVELGRALLPMDKGREWADKAFAVALRIDPDFKEQIEQVRKEAAEGEPAKTAKAGDDGELLNDEDKMPPGGAGAEGGGDDDGSRGTGPKRVGDVEGQYWGKLTDEQQAEAVKTLKDFAVETQTKMGKELRLIETKYFLFYSDLPKQEAKNWSGLLDRMYAKLADMFAIEKGLNIWRGKGLIFVFQSESDYHRFQAVMHQTDSGSSAGMCHSFGDGIVHIAFYRQEKELKFAHVLVHESVHGFLHRYKSPANIPSWANEGLAEYIARQLVGDPQNPPAQSKRHAVYFLKQYGGLGAFFETDHIVGWQYPVSEMLATFMIERNRRNYVAFINGMKEGLSWEEALKTKYKAPREKLVPAFGSSIGVQLLN